MSPSDLPRAPFSLTLQAERDRLRLLLEITNILVSRHDLRELFEALSECISRAIPHEYASVSLHESAPSDEARVWLVVLDGARVVEAGSHDVLLSQNGPYAELFRIQAAAYG